jgi:hypothetical protein
LKIWLLKNIYFFNGQIGVWSFTWKNRKFKLQRLLKKLFFGKESYNFMVLPIHVRNSLLPAERKSTHAPKVTALLTQQDSWTFLTSFIYFKGDTAASFIGEWQKLYRFNFLTLFLWIGSLGPQQCTTMYFLAHFCPVDFFRQMIALKITLKKTHF